MNQTTAAEPIAPAQQDALTDVALSHTVTEAERAAMADPADVDAAANVHVIGGAPASAAAAPSAPPAAPAPEAAAPPPTPEAADEGAAVQAAAPSPTPAAPDPMPAAPAPAPALALRDVPPAPKDFAAERSALEEREAQLQQRYDSGEVDDAEFRKQSSELRKADRELTVEQARYEGTKSSVEAFNASVVEQAREAAAVSFDTVSKAWMAGEGKEFMSNPLRAKAMQEAINSIDTETGGALAPQELIAQASKIAFEAYGYQPKPKAAPPAAPTPTPAPPAASALAARKPDTASVPRTLGDAPTSGVDAQLTEFSHLDGADVLSMERAIAGMSEAQRETWLREVDAPLT